MRQKFGEMVPSLLKLRFCRELGYIPLFFPMITRIYLLFHHRNLRATDEQTPSGILDCGRLM